LVNEIAMGKTCIYVVRNLSIVKCKVCTKIECKFKLLVPKWDSFDKLVKKGKWIKGKGNGFDMCSCQK
jgi:hypothetical protein